MEVTNPSGEDSKQQLEVIWSNDEGWTGRRDGKTLGPSLEVAGGLTCVDSYLWLKIDVQVKEPFCMVAELSFLIRELF